MRKRASSAEPPAALRHARVEREVYRGEGFRVLEVDLEGERARLVGELEAYPEGTWLRGEFEAFEHPRHGRTYRAHRLEVAPPPPPEPHLWLQRRLGLPTPPSPARARRALQEGIEALAGELGPRAARLAGEWPRLQREHALVALGLPPERARELDLDPEAVRANPYLGLLEGLSLGEAHTLAARLGLQALYPQGALLAHLLEQGRLGHTFVPAPGPPGAVEQGLWRPLGARANDGPVVRFEGGWLGLERWVRAEEEILQAFRRPVTGTLRIAPSPGYPLTAEQRQVLALLERGSGLLTGGPGTGKSHTCAAVVAACEQARLEVLLLAPTGKAAVRLAELTGRQAHTIHARLGWDGRGFRHGPLDPLPADVVLVDEAAMADVELLRALLAALAPRTRVLLVGDADQLPPVGPGAPFQDLLRLGLPQVRLTRLQRRAQDHPVTLASYAVREGRLPPPLEQPGLHWRLDLGEEATLEAIVAEVERVWRRTGRRPQVLVPLYRGVLGIDNLNRALKERLNPAPDPAARGTLRLQGLCVSPGDPLVQTRNDYALGLANGQLMEVEHLDERGLLVRLDDGHRLRVPRRAARWMRHAYALSVHRAQGSQWPCVMLALAAGHREFPNRELLYTALTRAQDSAWLFGDSEAYRAALERRAGLRQTWLSRLRQEG